MIDDIDCCRLAGVLMQMPLLSTDEEIWEQLEIEYGIEQADFVRLIDKLLPMIGIGKSQTTGKVYKGFVVEMKDGFAQFIVKTETFTDY